MAGIRLRGFALALIVFNVIATIVAFAVHWPAQFVRVGTDAGSESLLNGSAISAPLLPMVLFIMIFATVVLATLATLAIVERRRSRRPAGAVA